MQPYGLDRQNRWRVQPRASLSALQKHWLLRPGALTTALRAQGHLTLKVLRETPAGLHPQESWMSGQDAGTPIWVREIVMAINGVESVFARSFTDLRDAHSLWQGIRRLRTRPLADMLYHDARIVRSPFCVAQLGWQDPAYRSLRRALPSVGAEGDAVWARASVFYRQQHPLVVMECFLPQFWQFAVRA